MNTKYVSRKGFTLIELLVVVIIIAILAAIAVPQYKRATLKARFSTVMPMAKSIADAQEVYYQGRQLYALSTDELDVTPVTAENTSVALSTAAEEDKYAYVAAQRSDVPGARYIIYQKYSPMFARTIHCEADKNNPDALWLCEKGLNGQDLGNGSLQGKNYKTFLLSGSTEDTFIPPCPQGATCNDQGVVTQCASGQTLNDGSCVDCSTIPGAATCSTTAYEATSCNSGYSLSAGTCVDGRPNCPKSALGVTGGKTKATCTQVCENEDNPDCYKWDGGYTYGGSAACNGISTYECAGATYNGSFYGGAHCGGGGANVCSDSIFKGPNAMCEGQAANACEGSTFSNASSCAGYRANACTGTKIIAGAYCDPRQANGCAGALYGTGPDSNLIGTCYDGNGYCPVGVPLRGNYDSNASGYMVSSWKGNCCNPAYMVSGECPSGIAICS